MGTFEVELSTGLLTVVRFGSFGPDRSVRVQPTAHPSPDSASAITKRVMVFSSMSVGYLTPLEVRKP